MCYFFAPAFLLAHATGKRIHPEALRQFLYGYVLFLAQSEAGQSVGIRWEGPLEEIPSATTVSKNEGPQFLSR